MDVTNELPSANTSFSIKHLTSEFIERKASCRFRFSEEFLFGFFAGVSDVPTFSDRNLERAEVLASLNPSNSSSLLDEANVLLSDNARFSFKAFTKETIDWMASCRPRFSEKFLFGFFAGVSDVPTFSDRNLD